jgi:hypothetical protein
MRSYLKEKLEDAVYKAENTAVGIRHVGHVATSIRKSWHELRRQAAASRYSSLADPGHDVYFLCSEFTHWNTGCLELFAEAFETVQRMPWLARPYTRSLVEDYATVCSSLYISAGRPSFVLDLGRWCTSLERVSIAEYGLATTCVLTLGTRSWIPECTDTRLWSSWK